MKLPPLSLNSGEAAALLVACAVAGAAEGRASRAEMQSAMAKVRAVLPGRERNYVEDLDKAVEAFPGSVVDSRPGVLGALQGAVALGKIARIRYRAAGGEESEREVEPPALARACAKLASDILSRVQTPIP